MQSNRQIILESTPQGVPTPGEFRPAIRADA